MKKTIGWILGVAFIAVFAVVLVRAWLHRPSADTVVAQVSVEADETAIAQHLSEAVRFRTVSHQSIEEFEPQEFLGFIAWVERTYPEVHQSMERVLLGDYTILYRWPGTDATLPPVLLTAHYDVVPVLPGTEDLWTHQPFAGDIADGIVWGRGTLDDKSAVVAQLEAATLLLKAGFKPARTVYFSFGHDEEVGGSGAAKVAEYLAAQNVRLAWSLDEGSFVLDGLLPGVKPLMAAVNVAEKGSVTLQVVAKGAGGHSSLPPPQTAVGVLATAITQLEAHPMPGGLSGLSEQMFDTISRYMPFGYRILFANRWLFGGVIEQQLTATPFGNAMLRTTTAPTMLSASTKSNVLPIEAIATVNFRIHPRDTVESVTAHVRSVVANESVEVRPEPESFGAGASDVADWNSPGFGVIGQSVREIYGNVIVTPGLMIAASDSRHYGKVSDNAFRFNPMIVTQNDLTGFHGTNEKIGVATLAQGARTYAQIIRNGASH